MVEKKEVMAVVTTNPLNIYKVLGSFSEKKHTKTIELEDEYYVKCVHLGSDGSIKVGIVIDPEKRDYLKTHLDDGFESESVQTGLDDLDSVDTNTPMEGSQEKSSIRKLWESWVRFEGNTIVVDRIEFFDELHVFTDFKHAFSNVYYLNPSCCESAYMIINTRKEVLCSCCGKTYPSTGWCKPKPSITF